MWIVVAALSGAAAVIAGAFGAHGLSTRVGADQVAAWSTASNTHLAHSIVLLVLALFSAASGRAVGLQSGLFLAGVLLFSGSIYLLVLTSARWLGPVTPLGGLCLIAGWLSLLLLVRS